jgi:hypothetical protein
MEMKFCWRCSCEVPLLNEDEWELLSPIAEHIGEAMRSYRARTGGTIIEAQAFVAQRILEQFNRISGFNETNYLAVLHHRRALFGPQCSSCGFLLRTPKAKYCANCGRPSVQAEVANTVATMEK